MNIFSDFDGVLYRMPIPEAVGEVMGIPPPSEPHCYDIGEAYGLNVNQIRNVWAKIWEDPSLGSSGAYQWAIQFLARARTLGHTVHVITSRPTKESKAHLKKVWQMCGYGELVETLTIVDKWQDKIEILRIRGAELWIDDYVNSAVDISNICPVLLVSRPWNVYSENLGKLTMVTLASLTDMMVDGIRPFRKTEA